MTIDAKMQSDYDKYLEEHIANVKLGFEWMVLRLPELFTAYDSDAVMDIVKNHDQSKYDDEEYLPYCAYFYGKKTPEVEEEFNKAWLHHQHNNPHHWQHWLLREDDGGSIAVEMPFEYVIEMIADWWAFSWKKDNLLEIFDWYDENKSKMVLHPNTQKLVEDILDKLETKIAEVSNNGN